MKVVFFITFTLTIFVQYLYQQFVVDSLNPDSISEIKAKKSLTQASVVQNTSSSNLFSYDLSNGILVKKLTDGHYNLSAPAYANHSSKVAFLSNKSGIKQIWIKDEIGGLSLVSGSPVAIEASHLSWSPDDKHIMFLHQKEVFSLTLHNNRLTRLIDISYQPSFAHWSFSGESIYYVSDKSGITDIWKYSLEKKKHFRVSNKAPDFQSSLLTSKQPKSLIWRAALENKKLTVFSEEKNINIDLKIYQNYWQLLNGSIYYLAEVEQGLGLFEYRFADEFKRRVLVLDKYMLPSFTIKNDLVIFSKKEIE